MAGDSPVTKKRRPPGAEESNSRMLKSMRPGKDDATILSKSMEDPIKCFATRPMLMQARTARRGVQEDRDNG